MNREDLVKNILKLKEEKNAIIVAHSYQPDEIQELADVVGDSYMLSKKCVESDANTIVFCGVHFMAESAKILSPEKTVLLPVEDAGCPMADMATAGELRQIKKDLGDVLTVCYINTSAEVKAECDVCCTSSNADKIVSEIRKEDNRKILFVPDRNLGGYIAGHESGDFVLWEGFCPTHNRITEEDILEAKRKYPNAKAAIHPECREEVLAHADYIGSTKGIIDYCSDTDFEEYIIGTEVGVLYELNKRNKDKKFYTLSDNFICPNMKKTTLESVYEALLYNQHNIDVDEEIRKAAKNCLDRMHELAEK